MPEIDLLLQNARGIPAPPKKPRKQREKCPHLQWFEAAAANGERFRKCVMCPRTEVYRDGDWIKPKAPTPPQDEAPSKT